MLGLLRVFNSCQELFSGQELLVRGEQHRSKCLVSPIVRHEYVAERKVEQVLGVRAASSHHFRLNALHP